MAEDLAAVVMAGGLGTRMRSATPKHLHAILGRRMVDWVVAAARDAGVVGILGGPPRPRLGAPRRGPPPRQCRVRRRARSGRAGGAARNRRRRACCSPRTRGVR